MGEPRREAPKKAARKLHCAAGSASQADIGSTNKGEQQTLRASNLGSLLSSIMMNDPFTWPKVSLEIAKGSPLD